MDTEKRNEFIYKELDGTPDRFIKHIANKHYDTLEDCPGLTYTDLIQEGWVGLIEAAERYDDGREIEYSTYAYYWVEKYILKTLGEQIKTKQSEWKYEQEVYNDSPERSAVSLKGFEELSEREQEIIELYSGGYSQEKIGDKLEISQQRVSQILDEIKDQTSKNASNSV